MSGRKTKTGRERWARSTRGQEQIEYPIDDANGPKFNGPIGPPLDDLTGRTFGRLTVVRLDHRVKCSQKSRTVYYYLWECRCICGTTVLRSPGIKHRENSSCGCLHDEQARARSLSMKLSFGEKHVANVTRRFRVYKKNAADRSLPFDLNREHFNLLVHGRCAYCGLGDDPINGVDRVDNALGYTVANCVSCCSECNRGKSNKSTSDFIDWVSRVYWWRVNSADSPDEGPDRMDPGDEP